MSKNKIYVCGDSLSYVDHDDPVWAGRHWSSLLAKKMPDKQIVNVARAGAGNLSIALQIEEAIQDPDTYFVIINPSDVFRVILPLNRDRESLKAPHIDENLTNLTDKFWHNNFFTKAYTETFTPGLELHKYLVGAGSYLTNSVNERYLEFGPWSFKSNRLIGSVDFEILKYMFVYYEKHFDLSIRYMEDYYLLEGRLFKLKYRNIPFLFSFGALSNKLMKCMYPNLTKELAEELQPFFTELNLIDLKKSKIFDRPAYHMNDLDELEMVAELYYNKIKEIAGYEDK